MSLKFPPKDYIELDYNLLVDLLAKKYDQQNASGNMTENFDEDLLQDFPESAAEGNIIIYMSPLVLFFSTIGNILSLIILCRLCYEVWSTCVYLAIMSVFDQFIIYTWCGNNWLRQVAFIDISNELLMSSVSVCKVYTFLFSAIIHMQKWLLVCMSIELFIATKYPQKVPEMCTLSRAKAVILLLTVILACVNIHYFWTYEVVNVTSYEAGSAMALDAYMCVFVRQGVSYSALFENLIWPIIDISVAQILPLIIITLFTVLTIVQFVKGSALMDYQEENWRKKYLLYPHALKQLKISVLVICILFILTVPRLFITLLKKVFEMQQKELGFVDMASLNLTETIFLHFEYIFLSIKFYVLFICCRQFRAEFFKICQRICRYKKKVKEKSVEEIPSDDDTASFWHNSHTWLTRVWHRNLQRPVSTVQSKRSLMASNPSSIEFQTDTSMQTNHSLSYLCPHHHTVTTVTDVEHTIV